MKTIITIMLFVLANVAFAQDKKTETKELKVPGNCEQCKKRIENAASIKGVKNATWSAKTSTLTVIYKKDKTNVDEIIKAILFSGHDVDTLKAPTLTYDNLPECCKYRDHKH